MVGLQTLTLAIQVRILIPLSKEKELWMLLGLLD